jgi:hypothetical protein
MPRVGCREQLLRELSRGRIEAALDLLADDLDLPLELLPIEGGLGDGVREDVEALGGELARDDDVVDGLIEARPGVDLAARGLDGAGDLARAAPRRSLEQHVLVQMREARLVGKLVGAADPHPDLERGHGGGVVLLDEDGEAVLQAMAHAGSSRPFR